MCKELFDAIKQNNIEDVIMALENGADPKSIDDKKNTPFHIAASMLYIDPEILQVLLENEPDLDLMNDESETPLSIACFSKNTKVARILLNNNANPNIQNDQAENETPLYRACKFQDIKIVELLLEYAADPEIKNDEQKNALAIVLENSGTHQETLLNLLLSGSQDCPSPNQHADLSGTSAEKFHKLTTDIFETIEEEDSVRFECLMEHINDEDIHIADITNGSGQNLIEVFLQKQFTSTDEKAKILQTLANYVDLNFDKENFWDSFRYIVKPLQELLRQVLDGITSVSFVTETRSNDRTVLHGLSEKGKEFSVIIELLLKNGAAPNVNIENEDGNTPLHIACAYGHVGITSILLNHGAKPDVRTHNNSIDGETPLHIACNKEDVGNVKALLEYEADPNIQDVYGDTALHVAIAYNDTKSINVLLQYGANPQIKNEEGLSSLNVARKKGLDLGIIVKPKKAALAVGNKDTMAMGTRRDPPKDNSSRTSSLTIQGIFHVRYIHHFHIEMAIWQYLRGVKTPGHYDPEVLIERRVDAFKTGLANFKTMDKESLVEGFIKHCITKQGNFFLAFNINVTQGRKQPNGGYIYDTRFRKLLLDISYDQQTEELQFRNIQFQGISEEFDSNPEREYIAIALMVILEKTLRPYYPLSALFSPAREATEREAAATATAENLTRLMPPQPRQKKRNTLTTPQQHKPTAESSAKKQKVTGNITESFFKAAKNGDMEIIRSLLAQGLDVDLALKNGGTALLVAAENNHLDVVKALLLAGTNIFAQDYSGRTALNVAKGDCLSEILQLLKQQQQVAMSAEKQQGPYFRLVEKLHRGNPQEFFHKTEPTSRSSSNYSSSFSLTTR